MVENTCDIIDDLLLLLPQDVLIQILVLLPVISLLRFKSVCKSWRALIQSSFFIDLHLNNNNNNNNNSNNFGTFIFQTCSLCNYNKEEECEAFMLSSGSGSGGGGGDGDGEKQQLKWEGLGFPPCYRVHENTESIHMVGSCNGLICIVDPKQRDVCWKPFEPTATSNVSLWNPSTRQFRLLPKSLTLAGIGDLDDLEFVAFGYDHKTKDYKVVQISWFRPYGRSNSHDTHLSEFIFRVQVYNLSTDSWRLLEGINSFPGFPRQGGAIGNHGVYLNGIYYFLLAGYTGFQMILSFDFTKEIFSTIHFPLDYYDDYIISPDLTYLGEKLALFAKVLSKDAKSDFDDYDIWVLLKNEHAKEKSWTKIHSFQLSKISTSSMPKTISNDGEFALIATRVDGGATQIYVLQLFNLVTKEVKMEFRTDQSVARADVYKQSLVSIGVQHPVG